MILVYVPVPDEQHAKLIAMHLLERRLIACANIHPIMSMYRSQKVIQEHSEVILLLKTHDSQFDQIKHEIMQIHPYSTPCILKVQAQANQEFADWSKTQLTDQKPL